MSAPPLDPVKTARLTQRFPALAAVPERERLPLFLAARRRPVVLAGTFGIILLWLLLFGKQLIDLGGQMHGRGDLLTKGFLPVLVPFAALYLVHRWLIQREIRRWSARRPPAPSPPDAGSPAP